MDSELSVDYINVDPVQASMHHMQQEVDDSGSKAGDIIRDAQFFQDAATEYQLTYQSLDEKYTHQAILVKEASEALKASESHVSVLQEELMALKHNHETDIHQAVDQAVSQYKHQVQSAQSLTCEHRKLSSCRDKYKCFKSLWLARRICLQYLQHHKKKQI